MNLKQSTIDDLTAAGVAGVVKTHSIIKNPYRFGNSIIGDVLNQITDAFHLSDIGITPEPTPVPVRYEPYSPDLQTVVDARRQALALMAVSWVLSDYTVDSPVTPDQLINWMTPEGELFVDGVSIYELEDDISVGAHIIASSRPFLNVMIPGVLTCKLAITTGPQWVTNEVRTSCEIQYIRADALTSGGYADVTVADYQTIAPYVFDNSVTIRLLGAWRTTINLVCVPDKLPSRFLLGLDWSSGVYFDTDDGKLRYINLRPFRDAAENSCFVSESKAKTTFGLEEIGGVKYLTIFRGHDLHQSGYLTWDQFNEFGCSPTFDASTCISFESDGSNAGLLKLAGSYINLAGLTQPLCVTTMAVRVTA